MSAKVLPVSFGSTEEASEATAFVLALPGIAGAAAVQVAALALLTARHVNKSGRKPVLFEATALLCSPETALDAARVLDHLRKLENADVTRATRAYARSAVQALRLESPERISQALSNASAVLMSEHLRRSEGVQDEDEPQAQTGRGEYVA